MGGWNGRSNAVREEIARYAVCLVGRHCIRFRPLAIMLRCYYQSLGSAEKVAFSAIARHKCQRAQLLKLRFP